MVRHRHLARLIQRISIVFQPCRFQSPNSSQARPIPHFQQLANGGMIMAADESALVPVSPDDTVQLIIDKVRRTGAANVELLVPDDTAALQTPGGFERLRRAFDADQIGLLVISSDEQTLKAARLSR